jgi:hypothetical protein
MARLSKANAGLPQNLDLLSTKSFRVVTRSIDFVTYGDNGSLFGINGPFTNVFYAGTQHPRDPMCFVTLVHDEARDAVVWVKAQPWIHLEGISINPASISLVRLPENRAGSRVEVQFSSGNHIEIPDGGSQNFLTVYEAELAKVKV